MKKWSDATSVFHSYKFDTTIVIVTNSGAPQLGTDNPPVVAAPALLHALETLGLRGHR